MRDAAPLVAAVLRSIQGEPNVSTELAMPAEPIGEPTEVDAMQPSQVAGRRVGTVGTILVMVYLVVSVSLLLFALVELWPSPNPAGGTVPTASEVSLFGA